MKEVLEVARWKTLICNEKCYFSFFRTATYINHRISPSKNCMPRSSKAERRLNSGLQVYVPELGSEKTPKKSSIYNGCDLVSN